MRQLISQQESNRKYQEKRRRTLGILTKEDIRRNNHIQFVVSASNIHEQKYDYTLVDYLSQTVKVKIICPVHGLFLQTPAAHIHSHQGCPKCGMENRKLQQPRRKTTKQFIQEATIVHNGVYEYTLTEYINIKSKVKILCLDHGVFEQEAKAHLRGQGCPECANQRRASFYESKGEQKIEEFLINHNIIYVRQKTFPDCKHNMLLRFDFFLPDHETLIEFDGQQHYEFVPRFHGNEQGFVLFQTRDKIKNKYASDNKIKLVRICWDEENNIPTILLNLISS